MDDQKYYSTKLKTYIGKYGEFYSVGFNKQHLQAMLQDMPDSGYFNFNIYKSQKGELYIKAQDDTYREKKKPNIAQKEVIQYDEINLEEINF